MSDAYSRRVQGSPPHLDPASPSIVDAITDAFAGAAFGFNEPQPCSCVPCTTPQFGAPGLSHCAACCYGSLIEEYDLNCQVSEHRVMARRQWLGQS